MPTSTRLVAAGDPIEKASLRVGAAASATLAASLAGGRSVIFLKDGVVDSNGRLPTATPLPLADM